MRPAEIDAAAKRVLLALYGAGYTQADVWAILRRAGIIDCDMNEAERDKFLATAVSNLARWNRRAPNVTVL